MGTTQSNQRKKQNSLFGCFNGTTSQRKQFKDKNILKKQQKLNKDNKCIQSYNNSKENKAKDNKEIKLKQQEQPLKLYNNINNQKNVNFDKIIQDKYGISVTLEKNLSFNHVPLYTNKYLYNKFNQNQKRPSEVNIPCMIQDAKINLTQNLIRVKVINQKPVELWVICGGIQKLSITGLTLSIQQIVWCGKTIIKEQSSIEGKWHGAKPKKDISKCKRILFVLCQISEQNSLFYFNQYYIILKNDKNISTLQLAKQKIQWNSLCFNLRDIYKNSVVPSETNQNQQFQTNQHYLCAKCKKNQIACIFLPCRHMCLCQKCAQQYKQQKKCYICAKKFKRIIIYKNGISVAQSQQNQQEQPLQNQNREQDEIGQMVKDDGNDIIDIQT